MDALGAVAPALLLTALPISTQIDQALSHDRLVASLSAWFGAVGVLASLGLYGVTAYAVARRRTELGIRLAIGATPNRIVRMVFQRSCGELGIGMLIGCACSVVAAKLATTLVYGIGVHDPACRTSDPFGPLRSRK